jgi:putative DNA primase/helicase
MHAKAEENGNVVRLPNEPPPTKDQRPVIRHTDGEGPKNNDDTLTALASLGDSGAFVYSNSLVQIHVTAIEDTGVIYRPAGAVRLHSIDAPRFSELATISARHQRFDKRSGEWRDIDHPRRKAEAILSRGVWPMLPQLNGIAEAPCIAPDGRLIHRAGFDRDSGLFLHFVGIPKGYTAPPLSPTLDDALAALDRILEYIKSFPFVHESDRAAWLAAVLTALNRRSLPSAPMWIASAPAPGTGKSLLSEMVCMIALGRRGSMMALGSDENETEKRLNAALLSGDSIIVIDNIEQPLYGTLLCQLLTQSSVRFRPLGHSRIVETPTAVTILATGNSIQVHGDLLRRVVLTRLDAGVERPETRSFPRDALEDVRRHRWGLIRDFQTIILAYIAADRPHVGLKPAGGFQLWDELVRRPLVWVGCADPLIAAESLRDVDPDVEVTAALFVAWRAEFGERGATVSEAILTARKTVQRYDGEYEPASPALRDALQIAATEKLVPKTLGGWLRRHRDRVIDGLVLQSEKDSHRKVAVWHVRDKRDLRG